MDPLDWPSRMPPNESVLSSQDGTRVSPTDLPSTFLQDLLGFVRGTFIHVNADVDFATVTANTTIFTIHIIIDVRATRAHYFSFSPRRECRGIPLTISSPRSAQCWMMSRLECAHAGSTQRKARNVKPPGGDICFENSFLCFFMSKLWGSRCFR